MNKMESDYCYLGEIVNFQRGVDLPRKDMEPGPYPVLGSNGIIGWHNEATTTGPVVVIGRSGNVGRPFIYAGDAWAHNTSLYVKDFKGNDPYYIYYYLMCLNLENYAGGSAVPTLNRNHIHTLKVKRPCEISEQRRIAALLSNFDNKIKTNERINDNLLISIFARKNLGN